MSEADAMWQSQLSEWGAEDGNPKPKFEVVTGKLQDRIFAGSRAACWDFKRTNRVGFVRPYSGDDVDGGQP